MARVKIVVEREGGSTITIVEESAMHLFSDGECALLTQEAYVRVLRALGVQQQPDPEPTPPAAAGELAGPSVDDPSVKAVIDEALSRTGRKAA